MHKSLEQPIKLAMRGRAESPTPIAFKSLNDIGTTVDDRNNDSQKQIMIGRSKMRLRDNFDSQVSLRKQSLEKRDALKTNPRPANQDPKERNVFNFPTINGAGVNLVPYELGEKAHGEKHLKSGGEIKTSQESGGKVPRELNFSSLDNSDFKNRSSEAKEKSYLADYI